MALSLDYVAGFFDGEGCIVIHKGKLDNGRVTPRYDLIVSAYQCTRLVLDQLKEQFGGNVYTHSRSNRPAMRTSWSWKVSGQVAEKFLQQVYPRLVEKKDQAWLGLEFMQQKIGSHGTKVSDEQLALRHGFYLALQLAKGGTHGSAA